MKKAIAKQGIFVYNHKVTEENTKTGKWLKECWNLKNINRN